MAERAAKRKARAKAGQTTGKSSVPAHVARAELRHVRISPRKARLLVNMIKGKQLEPALKILRFAPKKAAVFTTRVLESAIANVRERGEADVDSLWVVGGWVNMGRTIKRYMPRAQGRASPIRKRSSHITLLLGER